MNDHDKFDMLLAVYWILFSVLLVTFSVRG